MSENKQDQLIRFQIRICFSKIILVYFRESYPVCLMKHNALFPKRNDFFPNSFF